MRHELDIQVTTGSSRAELHNQNGILAITFLVPMAVVAVAMWILSADFRSRPCGTVRQPALIAFCGGSAVRSAIRWLTSPADDKTVVWHPWLVDAVVLVLAAVAATVPST